MNYFDNHFLFSETYIKEYIGLENKKKDNDDISAAFQQIKDWNYEYTSGDYSDDPWIDYINAVLDVLKFEKNADHSVIELFAYDGSHKRNTTAICFMIDKELKVSSNEKGRYFAYEAVDAARQNGTEWAMLTNGYQWRLYHTNDISPYENYLEIDIEESIKNNSVPDEAFKLFHLFFNARTFSFDECELVINKIKILSDKKAEIIEDSLRGKAEEILKELCYGLKEDMNHDYYTDEEKKSIYNDAIIILYRLLFFGYAESRKLLPIIDDDPEYNYTFKQLCDEAKNLQNSGIAHKTKDDFDFWDRLDTHIRIYVDRSYNGGLFQNDDKIILKKHRISNGRLSKCLSELAYNRDKSGVFSIPIEYKDLSVRNLGSIYEGLLEYRLFIAEEQMVQRKSKGQVKYLRAADVKLQNSDVKNLIEKGGIYLSQDAVERKEMGAYYTPEDVVEYIVENTVGKKLEELRIELKNQQHDLHEQLLYENDGSILKRGLQNQIDELTISFIHERILALSIIDSAMGSGHFLVNAAYRVANEIVDMVSENNWNTTNDDIVVDVMYWKRKVVENCIYGIDINGLSVALARLSLWLISASNNKALSFIDHHLKEGNSIIGTDRKHVEVKDSLSPILEVTYFDYMRQVLRKYDELRAIGSNTKSDVEKQKEIYDEINDELKLVKKKYDYYLANQFNGGVDKDINYINMLRSTDMEDFNKKNLTRLWKCADEMKFFHWELEFPEVFIKGGFDIAIGNPPYVEVNESDYEVCLDSVASTRNLYSYMIDRNIDILNKDGKMSFIVLMSLITSRKMQPIRDKLFRLSGKVSFMNIDSATHPGRVFKKLDIRLTILNVQLDASKENKIFSTKYIRFFQHERNNLFKKVQYTKIDKEQIIDNLLPKIGNAYESQILSKLLNKTEKCISDYRSGSNEKDKIYFRNTGLVYYCIAYDEAPYYTSNGVPKISSTLTEMSVDPEIKPIIHCLFYSSLFYWFWTIYSDLHHFSKKDLYRFPMDFNEVSKQYHEFELLQKKIIDSQNENKRLVTYRQSFGNLEYHEYSHRASKMVFDEVDKLLGHYYGLSEEELNYILTFDINYRN